MKPLTTAALLGSYRRELRKEKISDDMITQLVLMAASKLDGISVADMEEETFPASNVPV